MAWLLWCAGPHDFSYLYRVYEIRDLILCRYHADATSPQYCRSIYRATGRWYFATPPIDFAISLDTPCYILPYSRLSKLYAKDDVIADIRELIISNALFSFTTIFLLLRIPSNVPSLTSYSLANVFHASNVLPTFRKYTKVFFYRHRDARFSKLRQPLLASYAFHATRLAAYYCDTFTNWRRYSKTLISEHITPYITAKSSHIVLLFYISDDTIYYFYLPKV